MATEKRRIVLKFARTGETTVEAQGYKGAGCTEVTQRIEAALGKKTSDEVTSEYHEQAEHVYETETALA